MADFNQILEYSRRRGSEGFVPDPQLEPLFESAAQAPTPPAPEPSFLEKTGTFITEDVPTSFRRALPSLGGTYLSTVAGVKQTLGDLTGNEELLKEAEQDRIGIEAGRQQIELEQPLKTTAGEMTAGALESILLTAPLLGAGAAGAGIRTAMGAAPQVAARTAQQFVKNVGLPLVGTQVAAETYGEKRGQDVAPMTAAGAAVTSGLAETLFERMSTDKLFSLITGGKENFLTNFAKYFGTEIATELPTTTVQSLSDILFDKGEVGDRVRNAALYIANKPVETSAGTQHQLLPELARTAWQTAIQTGITGGAIKVPQNILSSRRREAFLEAQNIEKNLRTKEVRKNASEFLARLQAGDPSAVNATSTEILDQLMPNQVKEAQALQAQYPRQEALNAAQIREVGDRIQSERERVDEVGQVPDEAGVGDSLRQEGKAGLEEAGAQEVTPEALNLDRFSTPSDSTAPKPIPTTVAEVPVVETEAEIELGTVVRPVARPVNSPMADKVVQFLGALGINPIFADISHNGVQKQGMYDREGNLYLNPTQIKDSLSFVASHEVVHHLKVNAPEAYEELKTLFGQRTETMKRQGERRIGDEEEQVADFVGELLTNEQSMELFARKTAANPTLFQTVIDKVLQILDAAIATFDPMTAEFKKATKLRKSVENVIRRAEKRSGGVGETRFSSEAALQEKKEVYQLRNLIAKQRFGTTYIQATPKQRDEIDKQVKTQRAGMAIRAVMADMPKKFSTAPKDVGTRIVDMAKQTRDKIAEAADLMTTEEGRNTLKQVYSPPLMARFWAWAPLQYLVSGFKNDPILGPGLAKYDRYRQKSQEVSQGLPSGMVEILRSVDPAVAPLFNKVANLSSAYQMSLFDQSGRLKTASEQTQWMEIEPEDLEKMSVEQRIAEAERVWEREGLGRKLAEPGQPPISFKAAYAELEAAANALSQKSPKTMNAYRQASLLLTQMHMRELAATRQMFKDQIRYDEKLEALKAELKKAATDEQKEAVENKIKALTLDLNKMFKTAGISLGNVRGGYWPLSRFGKYIVTVVPKDQTKAAAGEGYKMMMFESAFEQVMEYNRFRREYPESEFDIKMFTEEKPENYRAAVPSDFMKRIEAELQKSLAQRQAEDPDMTDEELSLLKKQSEELMNLIAKRWLLSRPETHAARRGQSRKTVLGYNDDAIRAAMNYTVNTANRIAYLEAGRFMEDTIGEMSKAVKEQGGDDKLQRSVLSDLVRRSDQAKNIDTTEIHKLITQASSVWLMSSPSTFFVQMAQPFVVGLPRLSAKYGGMSKAMPALNRGLKKAMHQKDIEAYFTGQDDVSVAVRQAFNIASGQIQTPEGRVGAAKTDDISRLKQALAYLKDAKGVTDYAAAKDKLVTMMAINRGVLSLTQFNEALEIKQNRQGTGLSDLALWFMKHGEEKSRLSTFYAAYELAHERAKGSEAEKMIEAFNAAYDDTQNTLGDYSKETKGAFFQLATPRVLLQFQYFKVLMLYRYAEVVREAIKGQSPEAQAQARAELKYFLFTSSIMSGLVGGPAWMLVSGWNYAAAIWNWFFGDDYEPPVDTAAQVKEGIRRVAGDFAGNIALYGPLAALGMDVSKRTSLTSDFLPVVPGGAPSYMSLSDKMDWYATNSILGPGWSTTQDVIKGMEEIADGDIEKGLVNISPKIFKDPFKQWKIQSEGGLRSADGRMIRKMEDLKDPLAPFLQIVGLNPLEYSVPRERAMVESKLTKEQQAMRSKLTGALDRAVRTNDPEEVSAVMKNIMKYNTKNRYNPIDQGTIKSVISTAYGEQAGKPTQTQIRTRLQYGGRELPKMGEE